MVPAGFDVCGLGLDQLRLDVFEIIELGCGLIRARRLLVHGGVGAHRVAE